jgi:hypothetical protein
MLRTCRFCIKQVSRKISRKGSQCSLFQFSPFRRRLVQIRFFSTPYNKVFIREKQRRAINPPTHDEQTLEQLFDLAQRVSRFDILLVEERDFLSRLLKLFTSSQPSVRYKAMKFYSSLPEEGLSSLSPKCSHFTFTISRCFCCRFVLGLH